MKTFDAVVLGDSSLKYATSVLEEILRTSVTPSKNQQPRGRLPDFGLGRLFTGGEQQHPSQPQQQQQKSFSDYSEF